MEYTKLPEGLNRAWNAVCKELNLPKHVLRIALVTQATLERSDGCSSGCCAGLIHRAKGHPVVLVKIHKAEGWQNYLTHGLAHAVCALTTHHRGHGADWMVAKKTLDTQLPTCSTSSTDSTVT